MRGKIMGKTHLMLTMALSMLLGACSDGPEQYRQGDANLPTGDVSANPEIGSTFIPEDYPAGRDYRIGRIQIPHKAPAADDVDDELVKRNSSKPMIYKEGFAGLTFDTTFDEAKAILSEPLGNNSTGAYLYREGFVVVWRQEDPKIPVIVYIDANYLGKMDLGANLGKANVGTDLSSHFADDDGTGIPTLKKYFNSLEGQPADYDCVSTNECQLVQNAQFYLFVLPSAMFKISKDRKVMAEIRMLKDISPGNMDNNFDLLNQNVSYTVSTADNGSETESIELGDSWDLAKEKIAGEGIETTGTNWFTVEYDGALLILSKDKYDRSYRKPEDSERLDGFYYTGSFSKKFTFENKYLSYSYNLQSGDFSFAKTEDAGKKKYFLAPSANESDYKEVILELVDESKPVSLENIKTPIKFADASNYFDPADFPEDVMADNFAAALSKLEEVDESQQRLGMKIFHLDKIQKAKAQKQNIILDEEKMKKDFFLSFTEFLKNEVTAKRSGLSIFSAYSGLHSKEAETSIGNFLLAYDENSGEGRFYDISMAKLTGNLSKVYSSVTTSDFNKTIFPALNRPVNFINNVKATELLGFKLGQVLNVQEVDNDREEATISSKDGSQKQRANFDDTSLRSVIYGEDGKINKEIHQNTVVGDAGVALYLTKENGSDLYRILQINSSYIGQPINGLCGINDLDLKIGQETKSVVAKLNQKIADNRQANADFKCVKFEQKLSDGSGQISAIFFPKQGVKLYFSENQFSSVGVYTSKNEALKSEVE